MKILLALLVCTFASAYALDLRFQAKLQKPFKCELYSYPPDESTKISALEYVNLEESPYVRWRNVVVPRAKQIESLIDQYIKFIKEVTQFKEIDQYIDTLFPLLLEKVREPYRSEILGISYLTNIPLGKIVFLNLAYDITSLGCTSIVAQDPSGHMFHARNMDWGAMQGWDMLNGTWTMTEKLRNNLVNVAVIRGASLMPLYYTTQIAGYVGITTGIKLSGFSLSIDARSRGSAPEKYVELLKALAVKNATYLANVVITREAFEKDSTFEQAKARLSNTPIFTPIYFILGGSKPGQGTVISRGMEGPVDVWDMATIREHPWYVLETNYDHWKPQPFYDRRTEAAEQCMYQLGKDGVSEAGLFNVLSSRPVLNRSTFHTVVMDHRSGTLHSWTRDCKEPCPLW